MASWLKVAEDLFEGVDRRAKRVVNELSDEQSELQPSVSSGQGVIARRTKPKEKGGHRQLISESARPEQEKKSIQLPVSNVKNDKSETSSYESSLKGGSNDTVEASTETLSDTNKDTAIPDTASSEVPVTEDNIQASISSTKDDGSVATSEDVPESFSSASLDKGMEMIDEDLASDVDSKVNLANEGTHLTAEQVRPESEKVEINTIKKGQENESGFLAEPSSNISKQQDHKAGNSPMEVQDQLDEAHGLLKSTISTGQSKEARLARVCAGLSSRLQEYKSENTQLEELLLAEREHSSSYEAHMKQLQQDLSASKLEVARVESNMAEALTAKNSEIESLVGSMEVLKIQASSSEGKLASLQANMEAVMRNRELTETRMMQALREELASAERRAEEERIAHNATKMAAVEREVELEHRAVEASNALARIQRTADESTSKAAELEHKVAVLEVECASLTQELQELEVRNRRGQKKASEEASQVLQMQAWQEEVERARSMQRDAEYKLSSLEAELQKMRVEMAGMKRDAEHYSRQEHMELEKRYRELTDLLYHKQTQLEAMASEKAAAEFQLEKEVKRLQEAQVEAERSRVSRRSLALWEEDSDIKVLEPLPLHHRHMAGASEQLQKAVKLLDSGAVRATRFLWRYPVARIILLFYLVFVHFFLMYLLHRLQEQADDFVSREAAMSMGLGNSSLH